MYRPCARRMRFYHPAYRSLTPGSMISHVWRKCCRPRAYVCPFPSCLLISYFSNLHGSLVFFTAVSGAGETHSQMLRPNSPTPAFRTPRRTHPPLGTIHPPRLLDPRTRLPPLQSRIPPRQARSPRTSPHRPQRPS